MDKSSTELSLGGDYLNVVNITVVKLNEHFVIYTPDGPIELKVDVSADLGQIPSKYHEIFINVLTAKYMNKVSFSSNPFSQCHEEKKKKWWHFWKFLMKL